MKFATVSLSEATSFIIDHRGKTPKKLGSDWTSSGHRVVSAINIKKRRVDNNDHHYVDTATYVKWMPEPLRRDDVLLTSEAPLGEPAYLKQDVDWVLGQRLFALRSNPDILTGRFLYYLLQYRPVRCDIEARATGTTVLGIKQSELRKVELSLPGISNQNKIAGLLGALDDKIESNLSSHVFIEDLLDTLYTTLCSNAVETSSCIGALGQVIAGGTPSKKRADFYTASGIPWLTPKDLSVSKRKFQQAGQIDITELGLRKSSAKLMPPGTVLMTSRAPIGYLAIAECEVTTNQGFKSIIPGETFGTPFVYYTLKHYMESIKSRGSGSTFSEVSASVFKATEIALPCQDNINAFNSQASQLLDMQRHYEEENALLAELRDVLLPELMSGRMRVDEAKGLVMDAVNLEDRHV